MNYLNKTKEFLKDPKKKALTQLSIYVVFFIFAFIFINMGERNINVPNISKPESALEYYENMISYDYKITYTSIDRVDVIEGTYYNNMSLFTYNNLKYYYEDMLYVINNDSYTSANIEYDVSKIFSKNLCNLFDSLIEESKTTYKDGKIVTNYTLHSNIIYNYLYNVESTYTNLVNVSITENNDIITTITFDLINLDISLNKIDVEYSNFNNIESLEFNKDNYAYEESL